MKKLLTAKQGLLLVVILLLPSIFYLFLHSAEHHTERLPIYGPRQWTEGSDDTVFYALPEFSLETDEGEPFVRDSLRGKVVISTFFPLSQRDVCITISANLEEAQDRFEPYTRVRLVSHLMGEGDRSVLDVIRKRSSPTPGKWFFVSGRTSGTASLLSESYLLNGDAIPEHPLVLLDEAGQIRGYYDATSYADTKKMMQDAVFLLMQEYVPRKEKK